MLEKYIKFETHKTWEINKIKFTEIIKVLEFPPCKKTITFRRQKIFTEFSFYQIFIFKIIKYHDDYIQNIIPRLFGSPKSLKSIDDEISCITFPHLSGGSICQSHSYDTKQDINKILSNYINVFWAANNTYYIGNRNRLFTTPSLSNNKCKLKIIVPSLEETK